MGYIMGWGGDIPWDGMGMLNNMGWEYRMGWIGDIPWDGMGWGLHHGMDWDIIS